MPTHGHTGLLTTGVCHQPFEELAKRAAEKYKSDYKRYYESLSADQVQSLGLESPALRGLKKAARNAVNRKARGEPARPSGSFFVFLHDFRNSNELKEMMERDGVEKAQRSIYIAKKAGEKWGVMSDEEKKVCPRRLEFRWILISSVPAMGRQECRGKSHLCGMEGE